MARIGIEKRAMRNGLELRDLGIADESHDTGKRVSDDWGVV